jgi:ABC-type lipoprotein export system ATPase subunit
VLDVCEHEAQALDALRDDRLGAVLQAMNLLRAEIVAALAALTADEPESGR